LHTSLPNVQEDEDTKSHKKCLGLKQIEDGTIMRCRKIRIFPNADYMKYFNQCFGATRYLYNKTISRFKQEIEKIQHEYSESAKKDGCVKLIIPPKKANDVPKRCCKKIDGKYFCEQHSECKIVYNIPCGFIYWRDIMIKGNDDLSDDEKWLADIPFDTRQLVVKNVMGGIKSAFSNLKNGNINEFDMSFRTKKENLNYFHVDHRALRADLVLFQKKFKKPLTVPKRDFKWLRDHLKNNKICDMIISREQPGFYYLQIPYELELIDHKTNDSVISIDPGVITQGTFYDPSGKCGKMGDGLARKIDRLYSKMDKLNSLISKEVNNLKYLKTNPKKITRDQYEKIMLKKKKCLTKQMSKLNSKINAERVKRNELIKIDAGIHESNKKIWRAKKQLRYKKILDNCLPYGESLDYYFKKIEENHYIKESKKRIKNLKKKLRIVRRKKQNVTKESHQKTISHYVENYKYIVIPELNAKQIAKKQKMMGMKREARKTMGMCHGKFMERLKTKVESIKNCHLIIVKEDYTSQTCGRCGILHKIKGRIFICPNCGLDQDRDTNAARNILIRGLLQE